MCVCEAGDTQECVDLCVSACLGMHSWVCNCVSHLWAKMPSLVSGLSSERFLCSRLDYWDFIGLRLRKPNFMLIIQRGETETFVSSMQQSLKTSANPAKSAFGTDVHSVSFALRLRHHQTNIKTALMYFTGVKIPWWKDWNWAHSEGGVYTKCLKAARIEAVLHVYGYECVFAHLCLLRSEKMIDGYVYLYETQRLFSVRENRALPARSFICCLWRWESVRPDNRAPSRWTLWRKQAS